jgi:hypothetical protein
LNLDIITIYAINLSGLNAGNGPELVAELLRAGGLITPTETTSKSIFWALEHNEIDVDKAKHGDLVFYGQNGKIDDVAFCLSDKLVLESSGKVRVRPIVGRLGTPIKAVRPSWE